MLGVLPLFPPLKPSPKSFATISVLTSLGVFQVRPLCFPPLSSHPKFKLFPESLKSLYRLHTIGLYFFPHLYLQQICLDYFLQDLLEGLQFQLMFQQEPQEINILLQFISFPRPVKESRRSLETPAVARHN
jgi:hypothetical protein